MPKSNWIKIAIAIGLGKYLLWVIYSQTLTNNSLIDLIADCFFFNFSSSALRLFTGSYETMFCFQTSSGLPNLPHMAS